MYVGTRGQICMLERGVKYVCGNEGSNMYVGTRRQICMLDRGVKYVCGNEGSNMYVGTRGQISIIIQQPYMLQRWAAALCGK
jgi:hypothetical protein